MQLEASQCTGSSGLSNTLCLCTIKSLLGQLKDDMFLGKIK